MNGLLKLKLVFRWTAELGLCPMHVLLSHMHNVCIRAGTAGW